MVKGRSLRILIADETDGAIWVIKLGTDANYEASSLITCSSATSTMFLCSNH